MPNPQNVPPFKPGEVISASSLEGLRHGVARRLKGLIGRSSSYSTATANPQQRIRERIEILNNTGQDILPYSLFAVKKSGTINYPWGPPVRTEAFDSQVGFNYVTNYDYAIANGTDYQCLQVGPEPNLIRYTPNDGTPKIGHPIGPLQDGSVSIKKCGYVVIAEPDTTNNRVWIVKSNDHLIRVKIVSDIQVALRGQVEVHGEELCSQDPGFEDPDFVVSAKPFTIDEVLNLTGIPLKANTFHYAKPVLGIGLCIIGEYDPIFKAESIDCFWPESTGNFQIKQLNIVNDTFTNIPNLIVSIYDDYGRFMLLPGEVADVAIYLDECGEAKFKLVGSYGLTRQAKATECIPCFEIGELNILGHVLSNCVGTEYCAVARFVSEPSDPFFGQLIPGACNGQAGNEPEEGRRPIFENEVVTVVYFESMWKILPQPIATHAWAKLYADMCPDDATGTIEAGTLDPIGYCPGVVLNTISGVQYPIQNDRAGASGKAGDWVKLDIELTSQCTIILRVVTVQHHCESIVVLEGGCSPQQGQGKFLKYETCAIHGYTLKKTSQMFCGDKQWEQQIQMYSHVVLANASLSADGSCNYDLSGETDTFCAFESQVNTPISMGGTNFQTASVYSDLQLEYDPGNVSTSDPSEDNQCAFPTLQLKGRPRTVIACDNCDYDPSQEQDPCPPEVIGIPLPLTLSTAYYRATSSIDSSGRKCVYLIPIGFVTFGDCEEGDPEEIICGNPCPTSDPSAS
jgi:hypothetical protein